MKAREVLHVTCIFLRFPDTPVAVYGGVSCHYCNIPFLLCKDWYMVVRIFHK